MWLNLWHGQKWQQKQSVKHLKHWRALDAKTETWTNKKDRLAEGLLKNTSGTPK